MPPNLGLMQINGLHVADEIVIVCQSQPKSANGLGMLLSSIERVREHLNPELKIKGVLITLYEKNTCALVA
jgi:chromosome partitioning protein